MDDRLVEQAILLAHKLFPPDWRAAWSKAEQHEAWRHTSGTEVLAVVHRGTAQIASAYTDRPGAPDHATLVVQGMVLTMGTSPEAACLLYLQHQARTDGA